MPNVKFFSALGELAKTINSELDVTRVANLIVEHGTKIIDAQFGAFLYHGTDDDGNKLQLVAIHGSNPEDFTKFGVPSATPMLSAHLSGSYRVGDVATDPLFGQNAHRGMPAGHPPVRSYMAVAVESRNGSRHGSLLFGHAKPNMFTEEHEQIIQGLVAMGAVALDNANLFEEASREIEERKQVEDALRKALEQHQTLLDELNHRVKNTLATVQSIALQTRNSINITDQPDYDAFYDAFESRLLSLSRAHNLLVTGSWLGVSLEDAIRAAIEPILKDMSRITVQGPRVVLSPNALVTINMMFHELAANACQYGSFHPSTPKGSIRVTWEHVAGEVRVGWREVGGPRVVEPLGHGFGTRLIERNAPRELGGSAKLSFQKTGLRCNMNFPVSAKVIVVA